MKNETIKIRLTSEEKELIKNFIKNEYINASCKRHMTISEHARLLMMNYAGKGTKK